MGVFGVAYTDAQKRATQKYIKENLEEVRFRVKKGEKAILQEAAKEAGQSMAQYVIQAINDRANRQLLTPAGPHCRRSDAALA